jgi:hypothetical protein
MPLSGIAANFTVVVVFLPRHLHRLGSGPRVHVVNRHLTFLQVKGPERARKNKEVGSQQEAKPS